MTIALTILFILVVLVVIYSTVKFFKAVEQLKGEKLENEEFNRKRLRLVRRNQLEIFSSLFFFLLVIYVIMRWL